MAEDEVRDGSDMSDPARPPSNSKEDADTAAARKELKHTVISEKVALFGAPPEDEDDESLPSRDDDEEKEEEEDEEGPAKKKPKSSSSRGGGDDDGFVVRTAKTPELEMTDARRGSCGDDLLREEVGSPKKKRAHEELDEPRDEGTSEKVAKTATGGAGLTGEGDEPETDAASSKSANGGRRSDDSEPEKKRHRDEPTQASKDVEVGFKRTSHVSLCESMQSD